MVIDENMQIPDVFSPEVHFMLDCAKESACVLRKEFNPTGHGYDEKNDGSPVTSADLLVTQIFSKLLAESAYKNYSIFGEEQRVEADPDNAFILDPLDGTSLFVQGSALFVFSLALMRNKKITHAIIMNPLACRTLIAQEGAGTFCVEMQKFVHVSKRSELATARIDCGIDKRYTKIIASLHQKNAKTPGLYATAEAASLIACGTIDAHISLSNDAYDIAAAKLIVEEAGGLLTDIRGGGFDFSAKGELLGGVISNKVLHNTVLRVISESSAA